MHFLYDVCSYKMTLNHHIKQIIIFFFFLNKYLIVSGRQNNWHLSYCHFVTINKVLRKIKLRIYFNFTTPQQGSYPKQQFLGLTEAFNQTKC